MLVINMDYNTKTMVNKRRRTRHLDHYRNQSLSSGVVIRRHRYYKTTFFCEWERTKTTMALIPLHFTVWQHHHLLLLSLINSVSISVLPINMWRIRIDPGRNMLTIISLSFPVCIHHCNVVDSCSTQVQYYIYPFHRKFSSSSPCLLLIQLFYCCCCLCCRWYQITRRCWYMYMAILRCDTKQQQ